MGAIGLSGAPTVHNDEDCARAALALVSDTVSCRRDKEGQELATELQGLA